MVSTSGFAWRVAWLALAFLVGRVVAALAWEAPPTDQVFQRVAPSVVSVRARGRDAMAASPARLTETGSGVLVSGDGKVLTAAFVVHAMDDISVEFPCGETVSARVVASEPVAADLALLQLDRVPPGSTVSTMADSNMVGIGDRVLVVGASSGLPHTLSVGMIRARWAPNTAYRTMPLAEFFQTDASINTGNSGGPMFNMRGEVIGIVSHNISRGDRSERQGFVVTLNTAKQLLLEKRSGTAGSSGEPALSSMRPRSYGFRPSMPTPYRR